MSQRSWGSSCSKGSLFVFCLLGLVGCELPQAPKSNTSGPEIPSYQGPEVTYCSNIVSYSGSTSVLDGYAKFKRREVFGTAINGGLGNPGAYRPIRFAEVRVTNSANQLIQCAETDANGYYSLVVPLNAGLVNVSVVARSNNNNLKAYVYDDPRYNNLYAISGSITPTLAAHTLSDITAEATGNVYGGAFNILDQLLEANIYLRAKVGNCSSSITGCPDFTVAPRVSVYWKLGFNPAEYYDSSSGISFYLPGYYRLFILGGIDGDYDSSDTDHFDNSVILHEYGHFLEDALFASDSPGGSHNGNKVIDPRLAWSEGWGNFIQAAVRNNATYIDTEGNIDGSTVYLFYVDLEDQTRDIPVNAGEGNFREFSVTRLLWDAIDGNSAAGAEAGSNTDDVDDRFIEIYHSLRAPAGWLKSSGAFRQIGFLHLFQSLTAGLTDWTNLRSIENQSADMRDYAQFVSVGSSCVSFTLTPVDLGASDNGSYSTSHLLLNNDFYYLRVTSGISPAVITLNYQDSNGVGTEADLDLFVYNESARYGNSSDMLGKSLNEPVTDASSAETESATVSLAPGNYLINVMAFTGMSNVGGTVNYSLTLNGSRLCPATLP